MDLYAQHGTHGTPSGGGCVLVRPSLCGYSMRGPGRWPAVLLICLLQFSSTGRARHSEEQVILIASKNIRTLQLCRERVYSSTAVGG